MARIAYLTPDTGDGTTVARCLTVPLELQPIVNGALESLCNEWNWEANGDMTISDAITALRAAIDAYYESEGCVTIASPDRFFAFWMEGEVVLGNALSSGAVQTQEFDGEWHQQAAAINDEVKFVMFLIKGTYSLTINGLKESASGIQHWFIDGVEDDQTIDRYSATTIFNQVATITVTIPDSGMHTVSCKMASKNGASSNYVNAVTYVRLLRTGD